MSQQPAPLVNITAIPRLGYGGQNVHASPLTDLEQGRFWGLIDRGAPDACWLWRGALTGKHGYRYGRFHVVRDGRVRQIYAHRLAYELTHGPLTAGTVACHHCDHTRCCNPRHIFAGSQGDNLRDASGKGHFRVPRPTAHKISTDQLTEIDVLLAGGVRQCVIAETFGVSAGWVCAYAKGRKRQYDRPSHAVNRSILPFCSAEKAS